MDTLDNRQLEWSIAERPYPGERLSGDKHLIVETRTGWLLAVVDGLGHGPQAAAVSRSFVDILAKNSELELVRLLQVCHAALQSTRGSACAIVSIDYQSCLLKWIGVGNVEAVVRHKQNGNVSNEYITMRGGIIGYRLPELQPSSLNLADGDVLAMATDGIDSDFVELLEMDLSPGLLASTILERYAKPTDDALVLVARYRIPAGQERGGVL